MVSSLAGDGSQQSEWAGQIVEAVALTVANIGWRIWVKGLPTLAFVEGAAIGNVDLFETNENGFDGFGLGFLDLRRDDAAASAYAFGKHMGVLFVDARADQRADNAAGSPANGRAGCRADQGRGQPAGGDDGAEARYGEGAKAGEEPSSTTNGGADACASSGDVDRVAAGWVGFAHLSSSVDTTREMRFSAMPAASRARTVAAALV